MPQRVAPNTQGVNCCNAKHNFSNQKPPPTHFIIIH